MATEDELYEAWLNAEGDQRGIILGQLFAALVLHAKKAAGKLYGLEDADLAKKSASEVIECLEKFRGDSKFSTWSEQFIRNHLADHFDDLTKERTRHADIEELGGLSDEDLPSSLRNEKTEDVLVQDSQAPLPT